ncbi:MAG: fumarylacetoacetate hydrolase family protein [Dysgonamonadaceae bacterium]|jgi:2-keto-4-pentenoate hydratase/2-oxohepta-3-ene-1,7-dioic acid hydratase in catechol pathway|nr:fumarylacetoacetate hydrolase family protein [Dysgonamonadaceae bacterium]
MKIICVGMNYTAHNKELQNTLNTTEPVIFMKSDAALLKDGKPFYIPDFSSEMQYEAEIVVKINRLGKSIARRFAHRYYDEITIGIDMTARDLQRKFRKNGLPWELCKSFDYSAVVGDFVSLKNFNKEIHQLDFHLDIDGKVVQSGHTNQMIFHVDEIIEYVSKFMTLKIGDLIFTGTPAGVGNVQINNHLQGFIEEKKLLDFYIK